MIIFVPRSFLATLDDWGSLIDMLDDEDPRTAREQFNARYGWWPFKGFTMDPQTNVITYPGDPGHHPLSELIFRDERIILYPHGWVCVMQKDGSHEICRMD